MNEDLNSKLILSDESEEKHQAFLKKAIRKEEANAEKEKRRLEVSNLPIKPDNRVS